MGVTVRAGKSCSVRGGAEHPAAAHGNSHTPACIFGSSVSGGSRPSPRSPPRAPHWCGRRPVTHPQPHELSRSDGSPAAPTVGTGKCARTTTAIRLSLSWFGCACGWAAHKRVRWRSPRRYAGVLPETEGSKRQAGGGGGDDAPMPAQGSERAEGPRCTVPAPPSSHNILKQAYGAHR
jgi:hypothetical protein